MHLGHKHPHEKHQHDILSLEDYIEKATNEFLIGPDWGINMNICDLINSNPALTQEVLKILKKKITKSKKPVVQILALTLLEALVKNCYTCLGIVGGKDFQTDLAKLAQKKKLDDKVRDRVLEIIATFALSFQNRKDFPGFEHTYIQLKRLPEINFPSVDPGAIFVPPSSNYQSPIPKPQPQSKPTVVKKSNTAQDFASSVSELYKSTRSSCDLLIEMLYAFDPTQDDLKLNDLIQELMSNCKSNLPKVQAEIEQGGGQIIEQLLELNDDILQAFDMYDKLSKGQRISPPVKSSSFVDVDEKNLPPDFRTSKSTNTPKPPMQTSNSFTSDNVPRLSDPPALIKKNTSKTLPLPTAEMVLHPPKKSEPSLLDLDIQSLSMNSSTQNPPQPSQPTYLQQPQNYPQLGSPFYQPQPQLFNQSYPQPPQPYTQPQQPYPQQSYPQLYPQTSFQTPQQNDPFLQNHPSNPFLRNSKQDEDDEWAQLAKRNISSNSTKEPTKETNDFNPFI